MFRSFAVLCIVAAAIVGMAPGALAAAPANDDITGATFVTETPFSETVDNSEATRSSMEDECGVATVWYRYTATEDGPLFARASADFETTLALYSGDASDPTLLACEGSWYTRQLSVQATAGETYYISVGSCCGSEPGQVGPGGPVTVEVTFDPAPLTTVEVTVDRSASVDRDGYLYISGMIRCDQPATAYFQMTVRQRFNRNVAEGQVYLDLPQPCGPEPTAWTAVVVSSTGTLFGPGNATAMGFVSAADQWGYYATAFASGDVHVRRRN